MQMSEGLTFFPRNSGVVIPKRIFVGGIPYGCTSNDLKEFFSTFGFVTHSKIVTDTMGLSKGYGFVTFERKNDARNVLRMGTVFFKEKKLKIRPAIRRFNEESTVQTESLEDIYLASNGMPSCWNNVTFSEYPSVIMYDANMQSLHPQLLTDPNNGTVSTGCRLMSHNAKERFPANSAASPQSTIVRRDLYNPQCPIHDMIIHHLTN